MIKQALYPILLVALLAGCSKNEDAPAPTTPAAAAAPAAAAPTAVAVAGGDSVAKGEHVYKSTCVMCHGTGAGGAPVFGSKDDWGPRIAQGKETLYDHAIKGFTGAKGTMPPKGANASLSDEDVKAAVDYMVAQIK